MARRSINRGTAAGRTSGRAATGAARSPAAGGRRRCRASGRRAPRGRRPPAPRARTPARARARSRPRRSGRGHRELPAEHGVGVQQEAGRADRLAAAAREAMLQRCVGTEAEAGEDLDRAGARLGRLDQLGPRAQGRRVAHGHDLEAGRGRVVERKLVEHGAHDHRAALGPSPRRREPLAQVGGRDRVGEQPLRRRVALGQPAQRLGDRRVGVAVDAAADDAVLAVGVDAGADGHAVAARPASRPAERSRAAAGRPRSAAQPSSP